MMRVDAPAALALGLLQRHLDSLIPEPYRTDLKPLFEKARETDGNGRATLHRFADGLILEGSWFEEGERGMWRIHLE